MCIRYSTPNPKGYRFERENIGALSILKDLPPAIRKKIYDDVIVDDFIPTDTLLSFWAVLDHKGRLVDVDVLGIAVEAPIGVDDFGLEIEAPIPEDFGEAFSCEEVLEQLEFIYTY